MFDGEEQRVADQMAYGERKEEKRKKEIGKRETCESGVREGRKKMKGPRGPLLVRPFS